MKNIVVVERLGVYTAPNTKSIEVGALFSAQEVEFEAVVPHRGMLWGWIKKPVEYEYNWVAVGHVEDQWIVRVKNEKSS